MTSETGEHIITIHILYSISASKENQTMEFSRLIKYKMRNIFLEELYTKCGVEASPCPFYKKSNLSTSLDQHYELLLSIFL